MPSVLHVAIWSVNTLDQNPGSWIHKAYGARMSELNQALAAFFRFRMTNNNVATSHEADVVRAIFVAPEYFFASVVEQDGYLNRDYVSEGTMRALKRDIPGPVNTLLVPGSVAHRKEATEARVEKYNDQVSGLKTDKKTGFIRNTAWGFFHARKVLSCSKQSNATDGFYDTDPDVFVPGFSTNKAALKVRDKTTALRFGIEICADGTKERGGKGYVDKTDTDSVDIKILVSASLPSGSVYHGNYTRALIHAAHEHQYSGIEVKGTNTKKLEQHQKFLGHPLDIYTLTLA